MIVGLLFTVGETGHGTSQLVIDQCNVPVVIM